jgi:hypothetical protein
MCSESIPRTPIVLASSNPQNEKHHPNCTGSKAQEIMGSLKAVLTYTVAFLPSSSGSKSNASPHRPSPPLEQKQ